MNIPVGLALYTLRNETAQDFTGTLERVAEVGYKGVEFAGYGNLSAAQMKSHLDRLGLAAVDSHVGLEKLQNDTQAVIEYSLEIGSPYITMPWAYPKSRGEYLELAGILARLGEKCMDKGIQLCYHNHAQEFQVFDGLTGMDIILGEVPSELLKAEVDVFWVKHADADPASFIKKYPGRCPLIHLKDMEDDENKSFAEVGNGIIDFNAVIAAANEAGSRWFLVEQDDCKRPPLESVKISFENLKKMGYV